jgi:hypothetical protein
LAHLVLLAALAATTALMAADDFPIVGTYTENTPCAAAGPDVMRVKITPKDIDSPILGLCTILESKRDASQVLVHVECKGPGGAAMLGEVTFTIKGDNTLDFADQDNTYKATLHKCPS